jgi:hypothetical protein
MNFTRFCLLAGVLMLCAVGCSTPESRIEKNQTVFQSLPPDVQTKIRSGQVEVGFAPAWVKMALGEPDRRYTRSTETGTVEVWGYRSHKPALSFGLGVAGGGGSSSVGGGVGVSTGRSRDEDQVRIVFANGKVTAVEKTIR